MAVSDALVWKIWTSSLLEAALRTVTLRKWLIWLTPQLRATCL